MSTGILPEPIAACLRLWRARLRNPTCKMYSASIARHARLGKGCRVERDVVLANGVALGDYSYVSGGGTFPWRNCANLRPPGLRTRTGQSEGGYATQL